MSDDAKDLSEDELRRVLEAQQGEIEAKCGLADILLRHQTELKSATEYVEKLVLLRQAIEIQIINLRSLDPRQHSIDVAQAKIVLRKAGQLLDSISDWMNESKPIPQDQLLDGIPSFPAVDFDVERGRAVRLRSAAIRVRKPEEDEG